MTNLPEKFIERMKKQLPSCEWEAFFACYQEKPKKGLRVNPLRLSAAEFQKISPYALTPVAWEKNGFSVEEEKLGAHPYHFAGVYYSQEPSAMCAAPLLEVKAGEIVLDLCSAPGGKGTQLAAEMGGEGLIVLNEPVFSRAKILSQNVERLGIKNAIVTCAKPDELSAVFPECFDKILIDAPCSGEGMFKKNAEEALSEWSEENIALCAARQAEILKEGAKMLRKGGRLVYSTCTFSQEEDEGQVRDYLEKHPEMRLLKQEKLYPHKVAGEGHFAALFEKTDGGENQPRAKRGNAKKDSEKAYRAFEKEFFISPFADSLYEIGGALYALPSVCYDWGSLQVLRVGVRLGEVKNGRFEPDHSLAMSAKKSQVRKVLDLSLHDPRTEKFLRGETVEGEIENGWCLVCVDGFPLGLGKAVNGTIKNHIPKGIRKKA
ncbi:MAG: RsmF rRNA methyltransferase first C-terminal domain-containing protein [Clostridia bacterium]|nr:RsmF rRNA methyltransferase first C-terminal domain-containing protein [Clostridia bacterium]